MWQRSFVAMSVLVGANVDDALAALPFTTPGADDLAHKLRDPKKIVRATALAEAAREVAVAVEQVSLR
jgi:hypothetical protein